jgi:thiol-disulfide isomerase/thioredoxin
MTSLGPIPLPLLLLVAGLAIAALVARLLAGALPGPRWATAGTFIDMLLVGLVAGRLAFVLQWWPQYAADPWAIVRPGDGGYVLWVAIPAGLAFGAWRVRKRPELRRPVAWGSAAGLVAWAILAAAVVLMQRSAVHLPDVELTRLEGETVRLTELGQGPMVVNLWATWCPPCRREMPVLAEAQARHHGITFVFVNQGEGAPRVGEFLRGGALALRNVVLDPASSVARATGARGLPTTLFFDAQGGLVDVHMGELTRAGLEQKLQRLRPVHP